MILCTKRLEETYERRYEIYKQRPQGFEAVEQKHVLCDYAVYRPTVYNFTRRARKLLEHRHRQ